MTQRSSGSDLKWTMRSTQTRVWNVRHALCRRCVCTSDRLFFGPDLDHTIDSDAFGLGKLCKFAAVEFQSGALWHRRLGSLPKCHRVNRFENWFFDFQHGTIAYIVGTWLMRKYVPLPTLASLKASANKGATATAPSWLDEVWHKRSDWETAYTLPCACLTTQDSSPKM